MKFRFHALVLFTLGAANAVLAQTAAPDRDRDGVPDALDGCPGLAGPASNKGCPVENAAKPVANPPAAPGKSEFEIEADKALKGFKPATPQAVPSPAASRLDALALPPLPGFPPARPIFQKSAFSPVGLSWVTDKPIGEAVVFPGGNRTFGETRWTSRFGYGVREAQLRVGVNLLEGKPKPKLDLNMDAEISWLLAPSDWGQMVSEANKTLETNPNDALALAKRAAGWRFSYRLDLLPATAIGVDAGRELYSERSKNDLQSLLKLPPNREAMPYVLAALRVKQFAPSAADVQKGNASAVKTTMGNLQNLNAAYAFFTPVAPEAVEKRVELNGQIALAMRLENDPNAPRQAMALDSVAAQVLAQKPKSPLALWRFVVKNPDSNPDDAKAIFAGVGDVQAASDTAARIAQTFWSVGGQTARGAMWANFAFAMAGPNASPLVKWVKAKSLDAALDLRSKTQTRPRLLREGAFGMSIFEADKVEALELLAQDATARSEPTTARRALEEAIGAGASPRFWMLLSRAAEAEAGTKTGLEAEALWFEALNANRVGVRYEIVGDARLASEIEPNNDFTPDGLLANTDKAGELDPLPARYAKPSPLVAARLHGAWLLLRNDRAPSEVVGGWESSEVYGALSTNGLREVEVEGKSQSRLTVGAQSALTLHRRFVRAQLERTPDIEETSRGTSVPIKFNRRKVLQKHLADLIKSAERYERAQ